MACLIFHSSYDTDDRVGNIQRKERNEFAGRWLTSCILSSGERKQNVPLESCSIAQEFATQQTEHAPLPKGNILPYSNLVKNYFLSLQFTGFTILVSIVLILAILVTKMYPCRFKTEQFNERYKFCQIPSKFYQISCLKRSGIDRICNMSLNCLDLNLHG